MRGTRESTREGDGKVSGVDLPKVPDTGLHGPPNLILTIRVFSDADGTFAAVWGDGATWSHHSIEDALEEIISIESLAQRIEAEERSAWLLDDMGHGQ